jgi:hypothetical protein
MPGGDALCDPTTTCKIDSDASSASGTCVALMTQPQIGDACDQATGCGFPLVCTGGHCAGLDPATCVSRPDAGASD